MAIITKIRNQSGLLIGVIGVAMLLFIVGGDFLSSGFGGGQTDQDVAEIHGQKIPYADFERKVREQIGDQNVNERTRQAVRDQVWARTLQSRIMDKEYDALGLAVSAEEIFYQVKSDNPSPILMQYFTDPNTGRIAPAFINPMTGGVDAGKIMQQIQQIMNQPGGEAQWVQIENAIKMDRLASKYYSLIKKGLYTTSAEAKRQIAEKSSKMKFDYVYQDYATISDSSINVSDAEMNAYYNEHNNERYYAQKEPARAIEYIVFNVAPSKDDVDATEESVAKIKSEFEATTDDTLFVAKNSELHRTVEYIPELNFPVQFDSIIESFEPGVVVGPYREGEFWKMSKLLGEKMSPDSVLVRHIKVKIVDGDTATATALVDSLRKVIRRKDNFADMASEFSEDFQSAAKGGELDWMGEKFITGKMGKEFADACFNSKKGEMQVVTSGLGVHLIEVMDKTEPHRKILTAVVDHEIKPGSQTYDDAYSEASKFAKKNATTEAFRTAGNELNMRLANDVKEGADQIPGLGDCKEIIRWVYKATKGDISEPFELNKARMFVVAHLKDIRSQGKLPLTIDYVAQRVKSGVILDKKAEQIIGSLSGVTTLQDASQKLGVPVKSVDAATFFANSIVGVGAERNVLGVVSALKAGEVSAPIQDNRGVYVVALKEVSPAEDATKYEAEQARISSDYSERADQGVFEALKTAAKVIDNRAKYF